MLRGPLHVLSGGNWLGRHSAALLLHLLLCHLVTFSFLFIMILIMIIIIIHNHHHLVDADAAYQEQQRSTLVKWRQAGGPGQILMMIIKSDHSQVRYSASESSTTMRMIMVIVMTCNEGGWEYLSWWWSSKVIKIPISDSCGHWSHLRGWQGDSNRTEQVSHSLLLAP